MYKKERKFSINNIFYVWCPVDDCKVYIERCKYCEGCDKDVLGYDKNGVVVSDWNKKRCRSK